jgi:hypothetical protein
LQFDESDQFKCTKKWDTDLENDRFPLVEQVLEDGLKKNENLGICFDLSYWMIFVYIFLQLVYLVKKT